MKGQVLDFSIQSNTGIISTQDGSRFTFAGSEWKDPNPPVRGLWVDFESNAEAAVCIYRALGATGAKTTSSGKTKAAATLWAIFLGGFGAHKFYMGSWGWGIIYLLTCWLYVPFIVAFIEWIHLVLLTDDEFHVRAEAFSAKGPFAFFW